MNASEMDSQDGSEQSGQEQSLVASGIEEEPFADPGCGMNVRANSEKTAAYAGVDYHFAVPAA